MKPIRTTMLLSALLFALPGQAAEVVRCATDAFGNVVCLDKDGVAAPAPKALREQMAREAEKKAAEADAGIRCAIDQFGNQVCAQTGRKR